jgi:hypothetical protein
MQYDYRWEDIQEKENFVNPPPPYEEDEATDEEGKRLVTYRIRDVKMFLAVMAFGAMVMFYCAGALIVEDYKVSRRPAPVHLSPGTAITSLKATLANRMDEHHDLMATQLQQVDNALALITPVLEQYVSYAGSLQDLLEHLPESIMDDHFASLAEDFKHSGDIAKVAIGMRIDDIKSATLFMEEETEKMEAFVNEMGKSVEKFHGKMEVPADRTSFRAQESREDGIAIEIQHVALSTCKCLSPSLIESSN